MPQARRSGSRAAVSGRSAARTSAPAVSEVQVHFLDVGERPYGDAVLCQLGGVDVLIDGAHPQDYLSAAGHPSIPQQLQQLLGADGASHVDLLIVTHAHQDHIGCLPKMVAAGDLTAEWALVTDPDLGWGRPAGSQPDQPRDMADDVVAGLREEPLPAGTPPHEVTQFLADARSLEEDYRGMLERLGAAGTNVVRYGRDNSDALLAHFADVGLTLLGPSEEQLLRCADVIAHRSSDARDRVEGLLQVADADVDAVDLYRLLVSSFSDAADADSRPGPAINCQSLVTLFELTGARLLFGGDMQLARPQVADPDVDREITALRERIAASAPYALVKLGHHGSTNAFDQPLLDQLAATPLYGICAGEGSRSHPAPEVLAMLDAQRDRLEWVRTDRNGLSSVTLRPRQTPTVQVAHGDINDARANQIDAPLAAPGQPQPLGPSGVVVEGAAAEHVEVITRVPAGVSRVSVTIDVQRDGAPVVQARASDAGGLVLGGGRRLPPLLFVTSRSALSAHIGVGEAEAALAAITAAGQRLLEIDAYSHDPQRSTEAVRAQLGRDDVRGVVLVGGYGVVASHRLDTLPPQLRQSIDPASDDDAFVVWSDDSYGDLDGDGAADLPVSRIPDGNSAALVFAALGAIDARRADERVGVRNVARPFAEPVFAALPGQSPLQISQPTSPQTVTPLAADYAYLMLHGQWEDASRFWGEDAAGGFEAVNVTNVPARGPRVVLAGCCWGALTVEHPAVSVIEGAPPAERAPQASMAMTLLQRGATAFVGCTGSHYSPNEAPYNYFGKPMHDAFWRRVLAGAAPADALRGAKTDYVAGFPHGQTRPDRQAIEYKILHQFTCLGLGW